jgi:hypothetical protein
MGFVGCGGIPVWALLYLNLSSAGEIDFLSVPFASNLDLVGAAAQAQGRDPV